MRWPGLQAGVLPVVDERQQFARRWVKFGRAAVRAGADTMLEAITVIAELRPSLSRVTSFANSAERIAS